MGRDSGLSPLPWSSGHEYPTIIDANGELVFMTYENVDYILRAVNAMHKTEEEKSTKG